MEFLEVLGLEFGDFASALLTGLVTLFIFMAREFWEERKAKRTKQDEQLDIFRVYGYPLLIATESLVNRLHEMFQKKPRFLRKDAPDIEFYQYNYISTLYRLCAVLGWIRAIGREVSSLQVGAHQTSDKLENSITAFQEALASNYFTAGKQVDYLIKRWELDTSFLDDKKSEQEEREWKNEVEKKIEKLVWVFLNEKQKPTAHKLKEVDQIELLSKVHGLLVKELQISDEPDHEQLGKYLTACLSVISRRVSWIYRDWQRAIGDFMLEPVEHENAVRRLELKPFHRFEEEYLDFLENPDDHRYLGRIDRLFSDLRPGTMAEIDVRGEQLKNVASKLVILIEAIWDTGIGKEAISEDELKRLKTKDGEVRGA